MKKPCKISASTMARTAALALALTPLRPTST